MKDVITENWNNLLRSVSSLVATNEIVEEQAYKKPIEGSDEHDLGHASKCLWELDKEA